jgi:hypothetical protein
VHHGAAWTWLLTCQPNVVHQLWIPAPRARFMAASRRRTRCATAWAQRRSQHSAFSIQHSALSMGNAEMWNSEGLNRTRLGQRCSETLLRAVFGCKLKLTQDSRQAIDRYHGLPWNGLQNSIRDQASCRVLTIMLQVIRDAILISSSIFCPWPHATPAAHA